MKIIGGGLLAGFVLLAGSVGSEARASVINMAKPESTKVTWKEGTLSHKSSKALQKNDIKLTPTMEVTFLKSNFLESRIQVKESREAEKQTFTAKSVKLEKDNVAAELSKPEEEKIAFNLGKRSKWQTI